jgi:hypothetical protein
MRPDEQNACYEPSYSEEPTACYDDPEAAAREAQERAEAERRRLEEYDKPIESDPLGNAIVGVVVGGGLGLVNHGVKGAVEEVLGHVAGDLVLHEVIHGDEESDSSTSDGSGGAGGSYEPDGGAHGAGGTEQRYY